MSVVCADCGHPDPDGTKSCGECGAEDGRLIADEKGYRRGAERARAQLAEVQALRAAPAP
jgi:hypothetical protein